MDKGKNIKGIKIRNFNTCMIVVACVLYAMLIYATMQMTARYNAFVKYNEEHIACHEAAAQMNAFHPEYGYTPYGAVFSRG